MNNSNLESPGDGAQLSASSPILAHGADIENPYQCSANVAPEIRKMIEDEMPVREILARLAPDIMLPKNTDEIIIWKMVLSIIDPTERKKSAQYNTIEDAVKLIKQSKNIVVISGAGISTSAGVPDFRSKNGIYEQVRAKYPDWDDPKMIFHIDYLRKNPVPFYQFAKELYPGQYKPTIGHKFIKCIEDHKKLLRNYAQNNDALERQAGISRVSECHGTMATASCTNCRYTVDSEVIKDEIMSDKIPKCPKCHALGSERPRDGAALMKPDIIFFGEPLEEESYKMLESDKNQIDLLIVIGSSMLVRPIALVPKIIPADVPQILINKELLDHMEFDIELLGNCDRIVQELCLRLGETWTNICEPGTKRLRELAGYTQSAKDALKSRKCGEGEDTVTGWSSDLSRTKIEIDVPEGTYLFVEPHRYLFEGAELSIDQLTGLVKDLKA